MTVHPDPGFRVEVHRGAFLDSIHEVAACRVDPAGRITDETRPGDAARRVFLRSAAKPFQAAAAVAAGVPERFGLGSRHLAVACGSHLAGPDHLALVDGILAAAGLDASALACGDDGSGGGTRHQCSGNHALAVAWCAAEGWPTGSYLDPSHPLQQRYLGYLERVLGCIPGLAPDGCGMTAYLAPLSATARAFGLLGAALDGGAGTGLPGLDRVAAAMSAHPELVHGPGGIDTELMAASREVVAKIGAEGLLGVGRRDGVGLALRVLDGSPRALGPAGSATAARWLGVNPLDLPAKVTRPPVHDARGQVVGHIEVTYQRPNPTSR